MSTTASSVLFNGKFLLKLPNASPRLVLALHRVTEIQWDSMIKGWWVPAESIFDIATIIESEAAPAAGRLRTHARFEEARARASSYNATISASCATDADISIPAPPGLSYLGYQKAGIHFAVEKVQCLIADEMGCVDGETQITVLRNGASRVTTVAKLYAAMQRNPDASGGYKVRCLQDDHFGQWPVRKVINTGTKKVMLLETEGGKSLVATPDHEILTPEGYKRLDSLRVGGTVVVNGKATCALCGEDLPPNHYAYRKYPHLCKKCTYAQRDIDTFPQFKRRWDEKDKCSYISGQVTWKYPKHMRRKGAIPEHRFVMAEHLRRPLLSEEIVHHRDGDTRNNNLSNLELMTLSEHCKVHSHEKKKHFHKDFISKGKLVIMVPKNDKIKSISEHGERAVYDIVMDDPHRNFVANGIVVHNCGKTIQALGLINHVANELGRPPQTLIVVPVIVKTNWYREASKWLVKKCPVLVVDGKTNPATIASHKVVIINYDILYKFQDVLATIDWDIMVGDEAHKIKNANTQRSMSFREISYFAERRILMTGTPIMNRPSELWHLLHVLNPEKWDSFFEFARRYCDAKIGKWGWDTSGVSNAQELQRILRETCMVRRLKKDVLKELPPKRRQVVEISGVGFEKILKAEQAIIQKYKKEYEKAAAAIDNAANSIIYTDKGLENTEEYTDAVKELQGGSVASLAEIAKIRKETAMAKLPKVIDFVKDVLETKDKVVVMAHHRDVVDAIVKAFGKHAVKVQGGQSPAERQVSVDRFRKDPQVRVFVGSIQAAGVGITLVESDTVVFAELVWTPAELTQAEDRIHRIGQENIVCIYHLVVEGSIDAYMAKKLVAKQEVIDRVINIEHI